MDLLEPLMVATTMATCQCNVAVAVAYLGHFSFRFSLATQGIQVTNLDRLPAVEPGRSFAVIRRPVDYLLRPA